MIAVNRVKSNEADEQVWIDPNQVTLVEPSSPPEMCCTQMQDRLLIIREDAAEFAMRVQRARQGEANMLIEMAWRIGHTYGWPSR